ncbi:MAG: thioredoxin fold domain-containing protein [Deltaproteobacteria bacterium]|nr:thioredoxin fold domain-containing protein [Deltaproteobacteria bacterium]
MGWLSKLLGGTPAPMPVRLDDSNFQQEVLRSDVPVLVDFWSATCAPCRQLEAVVLNLAKEYDGKVKICEANVETAAKVCNQLGIRSTPTVVYFRRGAEVERVIGFRGSLYHRDIIDNELLK